MYREGIQLKAQNSLRAGQYSINAIIHSGAIGKTVEIYVKFKNGMKGYFTGSKMLIRTRNNYNTIITQGIPSRVRELYTKTKGEL